MSPPEEHEEPFVHEWHRDMDGCCQRCSPCFYGVPGNVAPKEGPCEAWPCAPILLARSLKET